MHCKSELKKKTLIMSTVLAMALVPMVLIEILTSSPAYGSSIPKNGFQILSEYNFTYAACDYCPGGYWPDNKTGDHTLIIFATE
jgi:hypothetical protein